MTTTPRLTLENANLDLDLTWGTEALKIALEDHLMLKARAEAEGVQEVAEWVQCFISLIQATLLFRRRQMSDEEIQTFLFDGSG